MLRISILLSIACLLVSCTPKPAAINYGEDTCHFCMMTIVNGKFASEAVTDKGKVYKFDAIECMVNFLSREKKDTYAFLQVCDSQAPKVMLDATQSHFLQSKSIPSPMGAFLSAYAKVELAQTVQEEKGGHLMDWDSLQQHLAKENTSKGYSIN